jgi:hypothetical protein
MIAALGLAGAIFYSTAAEQQAQRHSVVVELFTSEGCSSCPPADAVLEKLDQAQSIPGAMVIALSEHVDYWNYIGWTDPWSSPAYSRRQEGYARRFHLGSIYTPQIIVNGEAEMVGDDLGRIRNAIAKASVEESDAITISTVSRNAGGAPVVEVQVIPLSGSAARGDASIFVAIAENSTVSHVLRGENSGRVLRHVAVVRSLSEVGRIGSDGKFRKQIPLSGDLTQWKGKRFIAFVQDADFGRIRGSASRVLSARDSD